MTQFGSKRRAPLGAPSPAVVIAQPSLVFQAASSTLGSGFGSHRREHPTHFPHPASAPWAACSSSISHDRGEAQTTVQPTQLQATVLLPTWDPTQQSLMANLLADALADALASSGSSHGSTASNRSAASTCADAPAIRRQTSAAEALMFLARAF